MGTEVANLEETKPSELTMGSTRHLNLAVTLVADAWMPVNPQSLEIIRTKLEAGHYHEERQTLIDDLKSDYSLYLFVLRALAEEYSTDVSGSTESIDPISLLHSTKLTDLTKILNSSPNQVSIHRFEKITEIHAQTVQEAMVSASTSEALAEAYQVDEDVAFSCALMRQVGMTLIAFNYPHVYRKVMSRLRPGESPDQALGKMLGFSPSNLALKLAQDWHMPASIQFALGEKNLVEMTDPEQKRAQFIGETLVKICEVGETLARLNNPNYPKAKTDWPVARKEIERVLGKDGMSVIQSKIESHCRIYLDTAPGLFRTPLNEEALIVPRGEPAPAQTSNLFEQNLYAKRLPPVLRDKIAAVYAELARGTGSKDAVDLMIKNVIPEAGFKAGCIYLLEPESMFLSPRLAMGASNLNEYAALRFNSSAAAFHPVISAFSGTTPLVEANGIIDGRNCTYICGSLGLTQKAGVVYLELSPEDLQHPNKNPLLYFKAIRQAFNDCFGLR